MTYIHFHDSESHTDTVCSRPLANKERSVNDPYLVSCPHCQRTRAYQQALDWADQELN